MTKVRVLRTYNERETVQCIMALHTWWTSKEWGDHRSHLSLQTSPTEATLVKPSLVRRVAAELPGVGWTRSQAVCAKFKTVVDLVMACKKDWEEIEGIGKGLSQKIMEALWK
jgi:ERCC4-type nuclease